MPKQNQALPIKSPAQIQQDWQTMQCLEIKNRYKALRQIASDICNAYKGDVIDTATLQFYMDVLKQVNRIHDLPRCKMTLSKMTTRWLELTGNANARIIKKIPGVIHLETATLAIGDPAHANDIAQAYQDYSEKKILPLINQGKLVVFATGSDGPHAVQVRLVDSEEPVLSSKEYQCLLNSTETLIIDLPTGTLAVADPCFLDSEKERMFIHVEPGHYKVCVYHFYIRSKVDSFYIVLCRTNEEATNALTRIPQFNS